MEQKQRHGCLTAWLVLMIIANSISALIYLFASDFIARTLPSAPSWSFPILALLGIFNVICAIALFKWKKWGFYGFIASSIIALIINLIIGIDVAQSLAGLIGLVILYGVLNIGKERAAWPQLD